MTIQKFVTYNSLDINGEVLEDKHELTFTVLEKSGNQLIHKDILNKYGKEILYIAHIPEF